ncbi:MAG TPA: nucleotidyl transferase AbiEii/AbiGii toxin family protein [Acidobacteriaceae bacterium]|nr:nucleotidyl transferase AbiEii/AbiGii toxin family protein [Acidobacteriaceae bacterium]
MVELSPSAIEDLKLLRDICSKLGTECVVIGAIAFQVHFPGQDRHTGDVDLALALNLEDFPTLRHELSAEGWTQRKNWEHEWKSARRTRLDILLAGPSLRVANSITWPESQMTMSLVGFEHVFRNATPYAFAPDLTLSVIPPVVLALLKMLAFLDDTHRREKDLHDIRDIFRLYAADTDREFSDEVFDANLSDVSLAPAFVLGLDLRSICSPEELALIERFCTRVSRAESWEFEAFCRAARFSGDRSGETALAEIGALRKGLR